MVDVDYKGSIMIGKEKHLRMYIGGEWVESQSKTVFATYNPANGQLLAKIARGSEEDVKLAVEAADSAFESSEWQSFHPANRGKLLYDIALKIRDKKEELSQLETADTGKPITQARADVEAAAKYFDYYAGVADKVFGETIPIEPGILDYTVREPIGITAHIVPWNYPIQIMARSTAAAIATGNAVIVKPAEDTPLTALKLAELIDETDLPNGILNIVTGYGQEAGVALVKHRKVSHVTFTGSVITGIAVMSEAAKNVTPVTLELGGKSPNIIFADCDMEEASEWVVKSIIQNAGQTCSAGSRLLIEENIKDEFLELIKVRMEKLTVGPGIEDSDIGPIISEKQFNRIAELVSAAREEGARIVTGGERVIIEGSKEGCFYRPTILDQVGPNQCIAQEEVFGPVVTAFSFYDESEALELANNSEYGLVAGIWTKDIGKAHRLAGKIKAGQIFINNYGAGGGIQMPFGGYKKSGFGREKGLEALRNYTQLKNVAVKF
ncbi:aldehyde dehydrogenase family protein [Cytobacillus purgationiresistens]|nr:aldehyde dehydrogenase family protein [Cytobacillus purgationiresistens]